MIQYFLELIISFSHSSLNLGQEGLLEILRSGSRVEIGVGIAWICDNGVGLFIYCECERASLSVGSVQ